MDLINKKILYLSTMTTDATNEDDDDNDCWDVFGSDDGDDNNDVGDDDYWEAFGSDDDDDDDNGDDVDNSNSNSSNAMGVKVLQVNQVATAASGTATAISVQVDNKKEMKKKNEQQQQWKKVASSIASYLSQSFLKHNSQIRLSERYVLLYVDADCTTADDGNNKRNGEELETRISVLSKYLKQRQIQVDVIRQQQQQQQSKDDIIINSSSVDMDMDVVDAVIILDDMQDHHHHSYHQKKIIIESRLRPGGILLYSMITTTTANGNDNKNKNKNERSSVIIATHDFTTKDKDIDKLLVQSTTTTNTDNNSKTNTINTASVLHTYKLFFLDDRTTTTKTTINTTQQHCQWMVRQRKIIRVHATTCPWLSSSSHSLRLQREEEHLQLATVDLSAHEIRVSTTTVPAIMITEPMIQKSVRNIQQYGYCILPKVLAPSPCYAWGRAVLECVHDAAHILKHRDHIDLYNPQSSQADPASYQELSMREDLRLDLRHGPALDKIRQKQQCYHNNTDNENNNDDDDVGAERTKQKRIIGNKSIVVSSSTQQDGTGIEFLRGQSSLLEIILRTMNPHNDTDDTNDNDDSNNKLKLWLGNIGRWNFNGCGNDGSYQNLRLSPVGGIVSLRKLYYIL